MSAGAARRALESTLVGSLCWW
ncbi:MAG: hypothetical protein JWP68_948, partial [Modestobacter sp.]|nr:hypothetical protein [Modestobacter sp.]